MELKVLSLGGLRHRFACSCCADDTATDRRPDASMVFISTMSLFTQHDVVKELATVGCRDMSLRVGYKDLRVGYKDLRVGYKDLLLAVLCPSANPDGVR